MAFGKLGARGGFGGLGALRGGGAVIVRPSKPVLTLTSSPGDNPPKPQFQFESDVLAAGDTLHLEEQASGGSWSSLVLDYTYTVTSADVTFYNANGYYSISIGTTPLPNASYEARLLHHRLSPLADSLWSNTVPFTINLTAAPTNTVAPVITGDPSTAGNILSATSGTWNGTYPQTYTYQWKRGGSNIASATNATYTLVSADAGASITCVVTSTNSVSNASQASNALTAGAAPANTVAPVLSGDPSTIGNVLTTNNGTWTGAGISYTYQWTRDGSNIAAATASSYTLVTADTGHSIACNVTATNSWGNATQASNALTAGAVSPVNTVAPAVTGTASLGYVLTTTDGTWTGTPSPTFAYQWKRDGTTNIGTNANTYTQVSGDVGHAITCVVTATNVGGSASQASNAVTTLAAPTLSFVAQASFPSGSGTSTRTYTSASIGNPAYIATRRVIAVVRAFSTGVTVSSMTIAGVSARQDLQVSNGIDCVAIFSAVVTSGTTGDIVATLSGSDTNTARCEVYMVDNSLLFESVVTGSNTGAAEASNTATAAGVKANSSIIAAWADLGSGTSPSFGSSTNALTADATQTGLLCGHCNSATAGSWSTTVSWTTNSTRDTLGIVAYR